MNDIDRAMFNSKISLISVMNLMPKDRRLSEFMAKEYAWNIHTASDFKASDIGPFLLVGIDLGFELAIALMKLGRFPWWPEKE